MSIWTFLLKLVVGRPRGYVEIFNQASNPTTILAEMIAADLLKLGWKETLEPQTKQELAIHHPMPYRYTIETKNYVIKKTVYSSSHLTPSFDVTAGTVRLWGKDLGIVIKAYDQASSLMKEKRAAEMLAKEQNKAIDVIEKWVLG